MVALQRRISLAEYRQLTGTRSKSNAAYLRAIIWQQTQAGAA